MPFLTNISLTEGKMVVGNKRNGKVNEYKCIVSHTLEPCKKLEDNSIANRTFTSCYNIKMLYRLWQKIHVTFIKLCMKENHFDRLNVK